jgi:hypothetical protein
MSNAWPKEVKKNVTGLCSMLRKSDWASQAQNLPRKSSHGAHFK